MSYKKLSKKASRVMADKSISKSFKGILRIAHILDSPDSENNDDDINKLSDIFYNNFRSFNSRKLINIDGKADKDNTVGYPKAYPYGLSETDAIARYKSEDVFKNAKLPICDSLGNYLNINIGLNGVVFGSNEDIGKGTTETKYFPILSSKDFVIGMDPIKKATEKSLIANQDFKVSIIDSETSENKAKLIVDHNNKKRTVYTAENKLVGDDYGLMVSQESWDRDSYDANETIDLKTELVDLTEYVKSRIDKYLNSNMVPVPPGTVIWQYTSLWNYYAKTDDGFGLDFAGHRPKLATDDNSTVASLNLKTYPFNNSVINSDYNTIPVKTNKLLGYNSKANNSSFTEIVPLYKRDYLLCDGKKYYITPINNSRNANLNVLFDRLINLFLAIGYHYTDIYKETFKPAVYDQKSKTYHYIIKKDGVFKIQDKNSINLVNGGDVYKLPVNMLKGTFTGPENIQDLLWSNDLTTLITYRVLMENGSINDLSNNKIPSKYIYYSTYNSSNGINYGGKSFYIGTEVNNFKSYIEVPVIETKDGGNTDITSDNINNIINSNNYVIKLKSVPIYNHPAVKSFVDLIESNAGRHTIEYWLNAIATFGFNVPNFNMHYNTQITDDNNNIVNATKYSNTGNNGIGGFIGTSAYWWSASGCEPNKQLDYICTAKEGSVPHRHYVFSGANYDTIKNEYEGWKYSDGPAGVTNCSSNTRPCYYRCDYISPCGAQRSSNGIAYNTYSYFINMRPVSVVSSNKNSEKFFNNQLKNSSGFNLMAINNIAEPNRCITSGPTYTKTENSFVTANKAFEDEDGGFIDFFSPECTLMLPLIKL